MTITQKIFIYGFLLYLHISFTRKKRSNSIFSARDFWFTLNDTIDLWASIWLKITETWKLKIKTDIGVENILSSIWLDLKHHYSMSRPLSVLHQTSNTALKQLWYKRFINSVKCCVTTCHMSTADIYYWGTRVLPKQWVVQWATGDPSVMWQIQAELVKTQGLNKTVQMVLLLLLVLVFYAPYMQITQPA